MVACHPSVRLPLPLVLALATLGRRFWRARAGATLVEFAIVFPAFILLAIGLIEVAMVLFVTSLMEGGLREAARFGITGFAPDGQTRIERILQIVDEHTQGLVEMDEVDITFFVYPSFNDIGEPEPFADDNGNGSFDGGESYTDVNGNGQWDADMGAAGLGGPGDIVLYTLRYQWDLLTGMLDPLMGDENGLMRLSASIVVRNEPFGSAGDGSAGGAAGSP
ncbi:TadE/TadG family type IV pilus assembly protein [Algihabitans albus]|uniref:TadE/TadG family type IV pilus assembly protein n=1 Tax=Algihabitans albus TaxID=2164067 RepID=UPI000E5C81AF|nr:TadE/TadG family type IV pilus assembly protein [Algihabitans albus]